MEWIYQAVCSFFSTLGLAVIFNAPRKSLIHCGLVGVIGWMTYYTLQREFDAIQASFFGAFVISILAHILARMYKMPMIIFSVAGIVTFVPGGMAFEAMRAIASNDYLASLKYATSTGILTGAIVMGLVFAEVFVKSIFSIRKKRSF